MAAPSLSAGGQHIKADSCHFARAVSGPSAAISRSNMVRPAVRLGIWTTWRFIGASMTDPELRLLLNLILDAFATTFGPNHYALMTEEDITVVERDRWMKDMKVNVIPVSKADNYAEVTEFLRELHKSAGP